MQQTNNQVKDFSNYFNIFRNKKIHKTPAGWLFQENYLTDRNILDTVIKSRALYGYFLKYSTDIFCIDVDLHETFNSPELKTHVRLQRYKFVVDKIGKPSLVFISSYSGGLHLYYKLSQKVFYKIIHKDLLDLFNMTEPELSRAGYDILPTPNRAIRLPHAVKEGGALLDTETLRPIVVKDMEQLTSELLQSNTYDYIEIFNDIPKIQNSWLNRDTRKQYKNYLRFNRGRKTEKDILPFIQKNTNKQLEQLCFNYFVNGITRQEATILIETHLQNSGIDIDYDLTGKRLDKRIKNHYARYKRNKAGILFKPKPRQKPEKDLFQDSRIDSIVTRICTEQSITHKGSISRITRFLNRLYEWTEHIKSLPEAQRITLTYHYKYFYHFTKIKKWIPLPYALLRNWNGKYLEIIPILQTAGILTLARKYFNPYKIKTKYNDVIGICNYYKVDFDKF